MNDFKWTDDLVAEFALQTKVWGTKEFVLPQLEKFKQSKQNSNKDWEIVSYEHDKRDLHSSMGECGCPIKSVRRLSDNEVFSVGDKVDYKWGDHDAFEEFETGAINKISISQYNKNEILFEIKVDEKYPAHKFLRNIRKAAKQKLFTTLDGKDIFYGESCWVVSPETSFGWQPLKVLMNNTPLDERGKYFSTESAAKNYIVLNKPCLSLNEINSCMSEAGVGNYEFKFLDEQKLNKLVNEKINDSNR